MFDRGLIKFVVKICRVFFLTYTCVFQIRMHRSFLPAHILWRRHSSPSGRAILPRLLAVAAAAAAVRMHRREIKLLPHRRRRGAMRVRVWRGGEAVSAHGENAQRASHVHGLQLHSAVRSQAAVRGPYQAGQVPRETRRLRDGSLHRRARDAAFALGARRRMCAL